ncbi:MAG: hypothetical protein ABMB14_10540 [Myxococcota bacterium]
MHRLVIAVPLLLASAPAWAGGIGILATGGIHTERLFFYSDADPDGNVYSDIDDYDQYQLTQTLPNGGLGFDLALGDRDDKIIGDCRFYWLMDGPQVDPAELTQQVEKDHVVGAYREEARHVGLGMVGLSWGIVGDPDKFLLGAIGHVGSAFITTDHTEYLAFDIGPGVTYRVARQIQLFGDVSYQGRHRKGFTHSVNGFVGARYMFD